MSSFTREEYLARQQQIIHQHMDSLSDQDREKLTQMSSVEKYQYFAQRNLLITNTNSYESYENIITTQLILTADEFIADLKTKNEPEKRLCSKDENEGPIMDT